MDLRVRRVWRLNSPLVPRPGRCRRQAGPSPWVASDLLRPSIRVRATATGRKPDRFRPLQALLAQCRIKGVEGALEGVLKATQSLPACTAQDVRAGMMRLIQNPQLRAVVFALERIVNLTRTSFGNHGLRERPGA